MMFDLSNYGFTGDSANVGGLWMLPGTDIYVRERGGAARASVGLLGSEPRDFATLDAAVAAAFQLASSGITTQRVSAPAYAGFFRAYDDRVIVDLPGANSYTGSEADYARVVAGTVPVPPIASLGGSSSPASPGFVLLLGLGALAFLLWRRS